MANEGIRWLSHSQHYSLGGHLAERLPRDPVAAEVNLNASIELLRETARAGIEELVFASSMSGYASSVSSRPLGEDDPATPDDCYGGAEARH
jgi:nucleoside-diphosphate-sugar epimerase